MTSKLSSLLQFITGFIAIATPVLAQTGWAPITSYRGDRAQQYTTTILARLIGSEWDSSIGTQVIKFQLMLDGKDVGAMEMIANCSNEYVKFERVIPVPDGDIEWFDQSAMPYLQQAKRLAVRRFCN